MRGNIEHPNSRLLRRGLLLLWSAWFSLVLASNLADGLLGLGLLPESWAFASGNLALIAASLEQYPAATGWAGALFGCVLLLQLAAAVSFWRAFFDPAEASILHAFSLAIALFAGFLIADEVFLVYKRLPGVGTTHLLVFCALLLSLLVVRPSAAASGSP